MNRKERSDTSHRRVREAEIHFELYRVIANVLEEGCCFPPVKYTRVVPELSAGTKSADLVVDAEVGEGQIHFLVIEVKAWVKSGLAPFNTEAWSQAKSYAESLNAQYFCVTDGATVVVFKYPFTKIGCYQISLDVDCIRRFLRDLADHYVGRIRELSLPQRDLLKDLYEKVGEVEKSLRSCFEELSSIEGVVVRAKPRADHLMVVADIKGVCRGLLRLGVAVKEGAKPYIHLELREIRDALGKEDFLLSIEKLSDVCGFQWLKENTEKIEEASFVWRYLEDVVVSEEIDLDLMCEGIKRWVANLARKLT